MGSFGRGILVALVLELLAVMIALAPTTVRAGEYHGRVVDAESGAPLPDAAVVVVWTKHAIVHMDGGETLHAVREGLTDANGYFAVSSSPGIDWGLFTTVGSPTIVIYKPGYHILAPGLSMQGLKSFEALRQEMRNGATIRLSRLAEVVVPKPMGIEGMRRARNQGGMLDPSDFPFPISVD